MKRTHTLVLAGITTVLFACGGASTPAPTTASSSPTPHVAPTGDSPSSSSSGASPTETAQRDATPAPASTGPVKDSDWADTIEAPGGVTTPTPLFAKGMAKSKFPKKTIGDKECWEGSAVSGDHRKDYEMLIKKCGAPTGLLEYVKPIVGKLHHKHDKRDTVKLKLYGGMCYRYFAVSDSGIKDLDILVMKPSGALVADDKTTHPIAIIEFDKSWCMDEDAEYDFHIEVDGEGTGSYTFGVWAKPAGT